jgi:hypothetical protein
MTDYKEYLLVRTGGDTDPRLIPAYDEDKNFILSLADGEMVKIIADDTRSLWRHRRFFLLLKMVHEHMDESMAEKFPTVEKMLIELKLQLGYMDVHTDLNGRDIWVATNSISFAKMGEKRFIQFVKDCRDVILKHFLPDVSIEDFNENFYKLIFD